MEFITCKTNISNEKALYRIAPVLNNTSGPANWQLYLSGSGNLLTVFAPGKVNQDDLLKGIRRAGCIAINVDDYYAIN